MRRVDDNCLDKIYGGGTNITGTLVNAVSEVMKVLYDAGYAVGSSIRRMSDKKLCPLE